MRWRKRIKTWAAEGWTAVRESSSGQVWGCCRWDGEGGGRRPDRKEEGSSAPQSPHSSDWPVGSWAGWEAGGRKVPRERRRRWADCRCCCEVGAGV